MPENLGKLQAEKGFTLIEMLVVISIMGMLVLAFSINLNATRAPRETRLATSRLLTEIRKVQSYTLASRSLPGGELAKYYLMKFDLSKTKEYKIQAITNVNDEYQLKDVETIYLPSNLELSDITISRPNSPVSQVFTSGCILLAFSAPFGKIMFNDGCVVVDPNDLDAGDDYYSKIITFQLTDCVTTSPYNPPACSATTNAKMAITLGPKGDAASAKSVMVNSITGAICPLGSSWLCATSY